MLLGLAVGETLGAVGGKLLAGGPLRAGVSTQLACFTAEGAIRASVRGKHKGICHPPSVVWHAYCRWAALQGIEAERMRRRWALTDRLPPVPTWQPGLCPAPRRPGPAARFAEAPCCAAWGGHGFRKTAMAVKAARAMPMAGTRLG